MQYRSTRGQITNSLNSPQAIIKGLAADGGLFVPVNFPQVDLPLAQLSQMSYQEIATLVLSWFFNDLSRDQLANAVKAAYGDQWETSTIAPLSGKHSGNYYLELFHGPTLAFKDIALQVLPKLMLQAASREQATQKIVILTATSGDTGTASMRGFSDQAGTQVIVFYPHGGVSPVQLQQMLGQRGNNLTALAIDGNFDDAQTAVKKIFNDEDFNQKLLSNNFQFSSANSMNIGRLIPQIVYYLSAYGQLVQQGAIGNGEPVNFTVPTGNFGDILAGYYAKRLGLPIKKLICASDENNVLTDFFHSGEYDRQRSFTLTNSPAMDILVSSNLERLLFDMYEGDEHAIAALMHQLNIEGHYMVNPTVKAKLDQTFAAGFANQQHVQNEISRIYRHDGYVIDPHTAVASAVTKEYQDVSGDSTTTVIISTASPYKFPETVLAAITGHPASTTGLPAIKELQSTLGQELSPNVQSLFTHAAHKERVIQPAAMETEISNLLGLR